MLFPILILLDQSVKYLIRSWGGFYICNPHISFGIVLPSFLFWSLWVILITFLIYLYFNINNVHGYASLKKYSALGALKSIIKQSPLGKEKANLLGLTFILSGAISNALDRLSLGCVIDFINLKIWPVFNLADVFIFFGAIILLSTTFKNKR
ncbi:MAG: signal peptidase II [Parcubacteria group bacterium]|jgi:hypothetical protein